MKPSIATLRKNYIFKTILQTFLLLSHNQASKLKFSWCYAVSTAILDGLSTFILYPIILELFNIGVKSADINKKLNLFSFIIDYARSNALQAGIMIVIYYIALLLVKSFSARNVSKVAGGVANSMSTLAIETMMASSYLNITRLNKKHCSTTIVNSASELNTFLTSFVTLISNLCIIIAIIIISIFASGIVALISISVLIVIYFFFSKFFYPSIKKNSSLIAYHLPNSVSVAMNILSNYRVIYIDGTIQAYINRFNKTDRQLRNARALNEFYSIVPKLTLESLIFVLITLAFIYMSASPAKAEFIQSQLILSIIIAQRLLPSLQGIYSSGVQMKTSHDAIANLYNLIFDSYRPKKELKEIPNEVHVLDIHSNKSTSTLRSNKDDCLIQIHNASFRYEANSQDVIKEFNLAINEFTSVALTGKSGSGKTTLINMMMGFVPPHNGSILIKGHDLYSKKRIKSSWQKKIQFVQQNPYFTESCLYELLTGEAFDNKLNYEDNYLSEILQVCKIDFIQSLGNAYSDLNASFSGGQLQRLALAKALYRRPQILFLDEFTSAFDRSLALSITKSLLNYSNMITIIAVTHDPAISSLFNEIVCLD